MVGQDGTIEHEGHDRTAIALSAAQQALVAAVSAAAAKPVVVVILTGGAVQALPSSPSLRCSRAGWGGAFQQHRD